MSTSRRQQSFGGVAALFGEDEKADATHSYETANEIQQFAKPGGRSAPSFGGVASMFGDDDEPERSVTSIEPTPMTNEPAQQQQQQNYAGAEDNPTPGAEKKSRQSSFGGVAALFGDEDGTNGVTTADPAVIDKEATKPKAHSAKSSFGGVASLFSPAEEPAPISNLLPQTHTQPQQNTQPEPVQQQQQQAPKKPQQNSAQKSRQQSFGGVATLFSSMGDEDEMKPLQSKGTNISNMFDPVAPAEKPQNNNNNPSMGGFADYDLYEQTNSEQPPAPPKKPAKKSERKSKRDPSISGVFSLFGDDQIPEQASPQMIQQRQEQNLTTVNDLNRQKKEFAETADNLQQKIELEETRTNELKALRIRIEREIVELRESKIQLIRATEMEMRHMRQLMADPDSAFQT